MTEQLKQQIRDYFERHRAQMVEDIKTLVRIPSVRGEATAAYPFGEMPYRALEAALKLAEQRGFAVQTYDNCIGTAELAAGEDRLDILAHLDVVPAADNWTVCPPFEPVERDGKLYGRGVADDKGPAVAALYAMACVRELGIPLKKNVRLVLGTDEECGSEDLPHYYDKVAEAPMTFSPDADFPVINIEKGRYVGNFSVDWVERTDEIRLVWFRSGVKTNVIPSEAECLIAGLDAAKVAEFCTSMEETVGGSLTVSKTEEGVKIVCRTAGGHAAYPQGGCNAMTALLEVVGQMPLVGSDAWFGAVMLNKLFPHGDWTGAKINIAMEDESGPLTVVPTMVELDGAGVSGCFDIRYPLCGSEKKIYEQADPYFKDAGLLLETISVSEPHYVPADTPLVQTLLRAYTEWTGRTGEALAIGGGTYVHDLKRGVAFGCAMPGVDNRIHGFDEFADIDDLILSAEIFTQAIVELCG